MAVILSILAFLILIVVIGKMSLAFHFRKEVRLLFSQSKDISPNNYSCKQLIGLPDPVQRYFNHVLKVGQPYISYARITHDGQFKTGLNMNWINIKGEQYATTERPGFIWKGTTSMFVARDMYISDKGRLVVSLFSLYNIVDAKGEQYNQGELLRWLGESILYPTNLLPGERLQWMAVDAQTARLVFNYKGLSLYFTITFNEVGEITEMETRRYMSKNTMETWLIKVSNYKEMNDVLVPLSFEVLWRLEKGDFSYARFNIKRIEYNSPVIF